MTLLFSACRSIGWPHLVDDIANFAKKPNLTALIPDIKGVDPDDAFSSVPYEKGFSLIYYIEQIVSRHRQPSLEKHMHLRAIQPLVLLQHTRSPHPFLADAWPGLSDPRVVIPALFPLPHVQVGAPAFEAFAKHYFSTYKKGTVTSADFKRTLLAYFKDDARLTSLPWDDLFYKPGLPPKPQYDTSLAQQAEALADKWYGSRQGQGEIKFSLNCMCFLSYSVRHGSLITCARCRYVATSVSKELQDSAAVFNAWPTVQKQVRAPIESHCLQSLSGQKNGHLLESLPVSRLLPVSACVCRSSWSVC